MSESIENQDTYSSNRLRDYIESQEGLGVQTGDDEIVEMLAGLSNEDRAAFLKSAGLDNLGIKYWEDQLVDRNLTRKWDSGKQKLI